LKLTGSAPLAHWELGKAGDRREVLFMSRGSCRTVLLLITGALSEAAFSAGQTPAAGPESEGQALIARACSQCHSLQVATSVRLTHKQWEAKIDQMLARGAKLTDDEIEIAAGYLEHNFGPPQ